MARLRTILAVFARHGLKNLIEKINLGDFLTSTDSATLDNENLSVAARVRLSFEELGPTFVKFGQLLASRPDMIPDEYLREMEILHDQVQPLPFATIATVLQDNFGPQWKTKFKYVDEKPLGSASIAQVHKAELNSGEHVVIKVQRPGIVQTINDDLNVLYFIADLLVRYIPEVEPFNPVGMVDEYFRTLELETNFVVEANNMRKFSENFKTQQQILIPTVHFDLTTPQVLVMQAMPGLPLSHPEALKQNGIQAEDVIRLGLKAYLKMVFVDGFFHGDLHAGNFFVMTENKIGLIDFGVVGRLNQKTQSAIVNMLIALSKEDYERLAFEYVDLAPYSEFVDVDLFAKELQSLISPYYGLTLKHTNIGRILMTSSSIAGDHGLKVPTELMLFFKSIIAIEGLGYKIQREFDFLSFMLGQVGEIAQNYFQPVKMANEASHIFHESRQFFNALPRQMNLILRRMNSPNYQTRVEISELNLFRNNFIQSFQLLFWGLIISALLISSSWILVHPSDWTVRGVPGLSLAGYALSLLLTVYAFFRTPSR